MSGGWSATVQTDRRGADTGSLTKLANLLIAPMLDDLQELEQVMELPTE